MNKYFNFVLLCAVSITFCLGQVKDETKLFAMIYTPGKKWNHDITFSQQPFFSEHSKHIQKLRKEGSIAIGGRYSDKGFMLLRATDSSKAIEIVMKDPSVTNAVFEVELFEFNTFYNGCLENKEGN
ncbi:MAG: hypothetical protein AAGA43_08040 [Bacteroidota bacterium]